VSDANLDFTVTVFFNVTCLENSRRLSYNCNGRLTEVLYDLSNGVIFNDLK